MDQLSSRLSKRRPNRPESAPESSPSLTLRVPRGTQPSFKYGRTAPRLLASLNATNGRYGPAFHTASPDRPRSVVAPFKSSDAPLVPSTRGKALIPAKASAVRYRFVVPQYFTHFGQQLCVVGSLPELGGWVPQNAPAMLWHEGHQWALELALPQETFEFKIIVAEAGVVKWEGGSNRVVQADEGEGNVPVEIVVWLTCHFDATASTQLQLAVPRSSIQGAYETSRATLEFLRRRRSKLGQDAEQADTAAERQRQAAELVRLAEAVAEQSSSCAELGSLLGREEPPGRARAKWLAARRAEGEGDGQQHANGRPLPRAFPAPHQLAPLGSLSGSESEDESGLLLLAIDSVRLPRALRRIAFANVVEAWKEGPLALSSPGASNASSIDGEPSGPAAAPSPFLRGELDSRAEELMSAAGVLLQEMRATEQPDAECRSSLASLAEEAGHVAGALASLGGGSAGSRATLRQLEGLASVGGALAAGAAGVEAAGGGQAAAAHALVEEEAAEEQPLPLVAVFEGLAPLEAADEAAAGGGLASSAAVIGLPPLRAEPLAAAAEAPEDAGSVAGEEAEAAEAESKPWRRAAATLKDRAAPQPSTAPSNAPALPHSLDPVRQPAASHRLPAAASADCAQQPRHSQEPGGGEPRPVAPRRQFNVGRAVWAVVQALLL